MADTLYERSLYEAGLDLDYAIRSNELHLKFYGRVRWVIAFIQLFAATAAAAPLVGVGGPPWLVSVAGFVLATITITDVLSNFSGRVHEHKAICRRYKALRAEGITDYAKLDRKRHGIELEDLTTIDGLDLVAYNDVVVRHGRESFVVPLTWFQRVLSACVKTSGIGSK